MNIENPKITMMTTDLDGNVAGRVVLNCCEWVVQPFQVGISASASDKEKALVKRAIWIMDDSEWVSARQNDGMETIKVSMGDL